MLIVQRMCPPLHPSELCTGEDGGTVRWWICTNINIQHDLRCVCAGVKIYQLQMKSGAAALRTGLDFFFFSCCRTGKTQHFMFLIRIIYFKSQFKICLSWLQDEMQLKRNCQSAVCLHCSVSCWKVNFLWCEDRDRVLQSCVFFFFASFMQTGFIYLKLLQSSLKSRVCLRWELGGKQNSVTNTIS